jgi:hypothetical protein
VHGAVRGAFGRHAEYLDALLEEFPRLAR